MCPCCSEDCTALFRDPRDPEARWRTIPPRQLPARMLRVESANRGGWGRHVACGSPGSFHCTVGNSPTHRLIQTTRRNGSVGVWAQKETWSAQSVWPRVLDGGGQDMKDGAREVAPNEHANLVPRHTRHQMVQINIQCVCPHLLLSERTKVGRMTSGSWKNKGGQRVQSEAIRSRRKRGAS